MPLCVWKDQWHCVMRNKILGGIGIVWGGLIVLKWLLSSGAPRGSAAYQSGQSGAVVLGAMMLAAGL